MKKYVILGIHDKEVCTVNIYNEQGALIKERNVARVRMFIDNKIIDEDFFLPVLPVIISHVQEVYESFLKGDIEKRMDEIEKNIILKDSQVMSVDKGQPEQSISIVEVSI